MRSSIKFLGLGLALAVAAGLFAFRHAAAQDGEPNANGGWTGKVAFQDFSMNTGQKSNHGAFSATMSWSQIGSSVNCTLTVQSDQGPQDFFLAGTIGNGNFWLGNENPADLPILLSGHVSGSGQNMKMKMNGVFVDSPDINELKIALKKNPAVAKR